MPLRSLASLALLLIAAPALAQPADAPGPLVPERTWTLPAGPLNVRNAGASPVRVEMTDFTGRVVEAVDPTAPSGDAGEGRRSSAATVVPAGGTVDLLRSYTALRRPGTYLLYATPPGEGDDAFRVAADGRLASGPEGEFLGTPLVVQARGDGRPGAPEGTMAFSVEPLRYARLDLPGGSAAIAFYYDAAPNTVGAVQRLIAGGFYDGLPFHRIVPGTLVQTGDPTGTGTGGPGFNLDAEFSDRPVGPGSVVLARQVDPIERQGALPRSDAADSGGSQFFVALRPLPSLDRRYTVFGRVIDGLAAFEQVGRTPVADGSTGRPTDPPVLRSGRLVPVTVDDNPYARLFGTGGSVESVTETVTEGVGPEGVSGVPTPGSPATRAADAPPGTPLPGDPPPPSEAPRSSPASGGAEFPRTGDVLPGRPSGSATMGR